MSYTLDDIAETFGCDLERAAEIEKIVKEIAVEGMEEKIEEEIPF